MAQVARISGPLLAANLKRTQANLAFDTDLLYIGHLTGKIGVKKSSPGTELDIFGQTSASEFRSDTLTGGNLKVDTSGVTSITGNIILDSLGTVHADEMHTEKLTFNDNYIGSLANSNIVFDPNGTGTVNFVSTKVTGDVSATGNITIPGDITVGGTMNFGDAVTDTLDFDYVSFTQDLKPQTTDVQNLGSANLKWNNVTVGKARIGDIEIDNDFISTTTLNNNLTVRASGTGSIVIDQLSFNGHNISTTDATVNTGVTSALNYTIDNPDINTSQVGYDYFGQSVSIDGNYALIGSKEDRIDGDTISGDGVAYLYNVTTGTKILHILNPDKDSSANFTNSLSLDSTNDRMVIGCSGYDDGGNNNSGRAYIYDLSGTLLHTLDNPNAQTNTTHYDEFGVSVAIDGSYCIIGAKSEDVGTTGSNFWNSGSAYIFNVSTGALVHTLVNPNAYDTSYFDEFGCAVDIDGNYAIVGAQGEDSASENNVGKAYIFNVSTGALVHTLDNPNPFSGGTNLDRFGSSVAIKGNYAIVGAAEEYNAAGNFRAGAAYIFDVSTGNLLHTLANPTTDQSEWFGFRVDISTDYAVVGAYNYNGTNTDEGVVHVYNISTGALAHTINNPNSETDAEYGRCAIDGTKIVSSAWKNNTGGTNSGQAYIHTLSFTTANTPQDLKIMPGSENLTISSVQALRVPDGTEAQRTNLNRDVRYNTTTNFFELFSTAYTPLRGIWSEDRQTYVLANADNSFSFYNNGVTNTTLTTNGLETNKLISQNTVEIDGNTISSATTNADFTLTATGTVNIANFKFDTNTIHNTVGGAIKLSKTGNQGYVHFDTVYGTVIPAGSTAQRPAGVLGQTRFNTDLAYMESWDGSQWANIAGAGGGITEQYMEELVNIYTIALA